MYFKLVEGPLGRWTHDNGNLELCVSRQVVGVIVGQEDIFKVGLPLFDELTINFNIKDGVNEYTLPVRLDVIGEDGQFTGLPLGHIEALSSLFSF